MLCGKMKSCAKPDRRMHFYSNNNKLAQLNTISPSDVTEVERPVASLPSLVRIWLIPEMKLDAV